MGRIWRTRKGLPLGDIMKRRKLKKWVKIAIICVLVNAVVVTAYIKLILSPLAGEIRLGDIFILGGLICLFTGQIMMLYDMWGK